MRLDKPYPIQRGDPLHEKLWHCPRSIAIAVNGWFEDFVRYDKGILPSAGGWDDQPAVYCEVMQLLHGETDRQAAEKIAQLEKERRDAQTRATRAR